MARAPRRLVDGLAGPLPVGATAPDWHLRSFDGTWHQHTPGRWAVLVFYPADRTPTCTRQLGELEQARAAFAEAGADVFGVNPAGPRSHQAFASACGFSFPVLVDRGGRVARHFRAALPLPMRPWVIRTVYAIDPAGRIAFARRGVPSLDEVLAVVRGAAR